MDSTSPEREKIATSTSSSPVVKDSPFFNYISNLSPLNEVKPSQVRQGFLEYNVPLPPSVFTSPRINPQPERSFLMRSKHLISSNAQLPLELDNRVNVGISNSEFFGVPVTQSMLGLAPCSLRGCNIKHTGQTQTCSHSGCVDDYLSDSMGTDCVNSAKLKSTKQGCDAAQVSESGCIRSNKTIATRQDTKNKMTTQVAVSEQSNKEDPLGKSFLHGEGPPDEHIIGNSTEVTDLVLSKRFIESSVAAQHCHHLVGHVATDSSIMINEKDNKTSGFNNKISMCSEIGQHRLDDGQLHMADNVQRKELDCNPQILSRSLHIVPACDNLDENSKSSINGVTENRMTNDSELWTWSGFWIKAGNVDPGRSFHGSGQGSDIGSESGGLFESVVGPLPGYGLVGDGPSGPCSQPGEAARLWSRPGGPAGQD
ncbi:hypothetical protein GIB67_021348 [Kingdonia uniflora]|uniref:Uncharacterized protein n=1 Tax=Kingdonia uniflora TaxID=39325 RepID=A0A7J7MD65_9MAGN|nr:hypothetical protein GIB67_021348 [Kingdonia uniflora]